MKLMTLVVMIIFLSGMMQPAQQLTLQQVFGYGEFLDVTAVGETVAIASSSGAWLYQAGAMQRVSDLAEPLNAVALDPTGAYLAAGSYRSGTVYIWHLATSTRIAEISSGDGREIVNLRWDDDLLIFQDGNVEGIQVWEPLTGTRKTILPGYEFDTALALRGTRLAVAHTTRVDIWDMEAETILHTLETSPVEALAFSPGGTMLATGHSDGSIRIWNTATWVTMATFQAHAEPIRALSFGAAWLASSTNEARLWSIETWQRLAEFKESTRALAFAGDALFAASYEALYRLDTAAMLPQDVILAPRNHSVEFSPDSQFLLAAQYNAFCADQELRSAVRVWEVNTGKEQVCREPRDEVWMYGQPAPLMGRFHPLKPMIAWGQDQFVSLVDLTTDEQVLNIGEYIFYDLDSLTFSPDGSSVAYAQFGTIMLHDTHTGELIGELADAPYLTIAMSMNDTQAAAFGSDGALVVWNLDSQAVLYNIAGENYPHTAELYLDEQRVVVVIDEFTEGGLLLLDLETGAVERIAAGTGSYHAASQQLAWSVNETVHLWNLAADEQTTWAMGAEIGRLAFSPAGTELAINLGDRTRELFSCGGIQLWAISTQQLLTETDFYPCLDDLFFSPDGSRLAAQDWIGTVWVWGIE